MPLTWKTSLQPRLKHKSALVGLAVVLAPALIHGQTRTGALDTSFGTGGTVITDFAGAYAGAAAVAIQADGKVVAAGTVVGGQRWHFAVVRYNTDGALATGFGPGGRGKTDFGGICEVATSVAVQPDGKIVVVGGSVIGYFNDFALARYNTDGTLDAGFGVGGKVLTDFGVSATAYSIAVQPDGKIVAAGAANIDGNYDFEVVRYNSDGRLDESFGAGGKVSTDFGMLDQGFSWALGYSLAIQPDGHIVVAGGGLTWRGAAFAVVWF